MTTATKPLPPHGTTARAKGRPSGGIKGCSCPLCRDAENRYDRQRRYLNATGRTYMVDAAPAAAHLRRLFEEGAGWTQLADATGTSSSTLWAILNTDRPEIRRGVAERILATAASQALAPNRSVPALGSIRRAHALLAFGHRVKDIPAACAIDLTTARHIVNDNPASISAHTAGQIRVAYARLSTTPGNSARSLNRAAREGWAVPGYWDDETFDDPDFVPVITEPKLSPAEVAERRREEVEHLAFCGLTPGQISERVDLSISTIRQLVLEWRRGYKRDRTPAVAA